MKRCRAVLRPIGPVLLPFLAGALMAGEPASDAAPPSYGQVEGRILCQDTGRPGRLAGVELLPEHPSTTPLFNPANAGQILDLTSTMTAVMKGMLSGSNLATVTGLDGGFALDKVPAGTYYVIAQLQGYRSPLTGLSQRQRAKPDQSTLDAVEREAQKVVVQSGETAHVAIELSRGAVLSGTIAYDDGTPVPGVSPALLRRGPDAKWNELGLAGTRPIVTDDRGAFRFSGLPAGQYAIKADLPTTQTLIGIGSTGISMHLNFNDSLAVYSGGALREGDIKPIELADRGIQDDIKIIFPLSGLRTISGRILAESDQHAVNSATIELQDPNSHFALRIGTIGADGTFTLHYVPDGTYVLKVPGAADTKQSGTDATGGLSALLKCQVIKSYGPTQLPLTVTADASGLVLQVPDAQPGQTDAQTTSVRAGFAAGCLSALPTPQP